MATSKEAPKKEDAAEKEAPPKKSKKLLIIIVAAVVLLGAIAGGTLMLLNKNKAAANADDEAADEPAAAHAVHEWPKYDPSKPPVFLPLEPFTVNLQPENGEQFLQVVASLRVIDAHVGDQVKAYMPQIRHEVLSLLAGKKPSEITSPEGREALAEEIKDITNEIMGWEPPPVTKKKKAGSEAVGPVVSVFFTQFIVQ
ncbi:MAG: flagellar basal body-associated protein [Proteobacteria bacterium]|nr:flagellar basal body-associated protein [Pseudomonadota bacterium]